MPVASSLLKHALKLATAQRNQHSALLRLLHPSVSSIGWNGTWQHRRHWPNVLQGDECRRAVGRSKFACVLCVAASDGLQQEDKHAGRPSSVSSCCLGRMLSTRLNARPSHPRRLTDSQSLNKHLWGNSLVQQQSQKS